ncbi:hypothetical protein [Oceanicoccus sp. KOV_DT_Chl]|uniref:hypothetical protein n=1 Tax=Oceanicoccus sp. KOV_DT_Chl TaxID=1904639 RepID=UPI000C7B4012|nr:hypothetical protein [Oceanicoccus sp. KOV_DT_Chl]
MKLRRILLLIIGISLTACGGGGGGSSSETTAANTSPGNGELPELSNDSASLDGGFSSAPAMISNSAGMLSCTTEALIDPASTITGSIAYQRVPLTRSGLDYNNIIDLPARGLIVEAVDANNGSCSEDVVAATLSNGRGEYGLNVPVNQAVCIQVRAQLYRGNNNSGASWNIQLTDNTQDNAPYYLIDDRVATPDNLSERHLLAAAGTENLASDYTQTRAAAPFAILDVACEAIDTLLTVDSNIELPLLYVHWSKNNTVAKASDDKSLDEGDIGGAFFKQSQTTQNGTTVSVINQIYLLGDEDSNTDEYDPHVITHEFAHYISANFGRYDARGGSHILGQRLDMRLAFEEGWADAFSAIALDSASIDIVEDASNYRDSSGINQSRTFRFNLDANNKSGRGWYSEASVYSILYNLFDDSNDGVNDQVSLGFVPLFETLTSSALKQSDAFISLYPFINRLKATRSEDYSIDTLLADQDFESINSDFGIEEDPTNNDISNNDDIVAVYSELLISQVLTLCSTDQYGLENKLANYQFAYFNATQNKTYAFTVTPVSDGSATDNGKGSIEIYRRGVLQAYHAADNYGESLDFSVPLSGVYTIALAHADNVDSDLPSPGRYCFELRVDG